MKVNDVMHSPAEWVSAETPVSEVAARMASAALLQNSDRRGFTL